MTTPVFLDGPLAGQQHEVSTDAIEQGIYRAGPDLSDVYTFATVRALGLTMVVASVRTGIIPMGELASALLSDAARAATLDES